MRSSILALRKRGAGFDGSSVLPWRFSDLYPPTEVLISREGKQPHAPASDHEDGTMDQNFRGWVLVARSAYGHKSDIHEGPGITGLTRSGTSA